MSLVLRVHACSPPNPLARPQTPAHVSSMADAAAAAGLSVEPPRPPPGAAGGYSLKLMTDKVCGSGSFGVVFQATIVETGEYVAIKKVRRRRGAGGAGWCTARGGVSVPLPSLPTHTAGAPGPPV